MVFGTFDVIHPGHVYFLNEAKRREKKTYLIVSVARDANVKKIKNRLPDNNEKKRLSHIRQLKIADLVVLGAPVDYLSHIIKYRPQILALGYDQLAYTYNLKKLLNAKGWQGKIIRLKAFKPQKFKSSIIKKQQDLG